MLFPTHESVELRAHRTENEIEMERRVIHDYLELSSPQLTDAVQSQIPVDFVFTANDMQQLQLRQQHVAIWQDHIKIFLNAHLDMTRFPYEITRVMIEHRGDGCVASCTVTEKVAAGD